MSPEAFAEKQEAGEFLESCYVYGKHWYGTLKSAVNTSLSAGKWVILEIDVEGARKVIRLHPDAIRLFVGLPTVAEIEKRLRDRGTEDERAIQRRLEVAKVELDHCSEYDFFVVNDVVQRTANEICEILTRSKVRDA